MHIGHEALRLVRQGLFIERADTLHYRFDIADAAGREAGDTAGQGVAETAELLAWQRAVDPAVVLELGYGGNGVASSTWAGKRIDLQPREFRLLEYLVRHRGQVVTRSMLLEGVWDYHFDPGTNVIDVHVSRLRKKLDEGGAGNIVQTVRGTGYRVGGETVTA